MKLPQSPLTALANLRAGGLIATYLDIVALSTIGGLGDGARRIRPQGALGETRLGCGAAQIVHDETESYDARRMALDEAVGVTRRSLALLRRELAMAERMSAKGLMSEVEVMRSQRQVNDLAVGRPLALHQSQIGFASFPLAKLVLQVFQGAAFFGHQQNATGFTVQPVHQFQHAGRGTSPAQLLNDAKAHPTAPMHSHASGFIDGQQVVILK